ncbi:unnamed protein product [Caretta caretta]
METEAWQPMEQHDLQSTGAVQHGDGGLAAHGTHDLQSTEAVQHGDGGLAAHGTHDLQSTGAVQHGDGGLAAHGTQTCSPQERCSMETEAWQPMEPAAHRSGAAWRRRLGSPWNLQSTGAVQHGDGGLAAHGTHDLQPTGAVQHGDGGLAAHGTQPAAHRSGAAWRRRLGSPWNLQSTGVVQHGDGGLAAHGTCSPQERCSTETEAWQPMEPAVHRSGAARRRRLGSPWNLRPTGAVQHGDGGSSMYRVASGRGGDGTGLELLQWPLGTNGMMQQCSTEINQ